VTKNLETVEELVRDLSAIECPTQADPVVSDPLAERRTVKRESLSKPRGYFHRRVDQAPWPPNGVAEPGFQAPRPLPKRPTGRFFIGSLFAAICLTSGWYVWSNFMDVSAYGVVKGDTLTIRSPWDGKISQIHVVEGQTAVKGELLVTLESNELARELDRLQDELRMEQAKLESENVRLRHEHQSENAEYLQLWGSLQKNREELLRLQGDLARIQKVKESHVITGQEHDRIVFMELGQRKLVEKLTAAVEELRERSTDGVLTEAPLAMLQLKPTLARIEYLEGQVRRTQVEIRDGELRSPVTGIVGRRYAAVGQVVSHLDTIVEVTDQDSLRIELFISQDDIDGFEIGKHLNVSIEPLSQAVVCNVVGSRKHFEEAPESIHRYYASRQTLMPLILRPIDNASDQLLNVGAIVKMKLLANLEWTSPHAALWLHNQPLTPRIAP
jgi:multidrug resistance efflux pump